MPADDFSLAVSALWTHLGLGSPRFSQPGRVRLRVEAVGLDLVDNGRGALDIEGSAGRLAPAPLRAEQVRRILSTNMGLLVGNDAGVFARAGLDGEAVLAVRTTYRYRTGSIDRLVRKIEDTVRVLEYYAAELKSATVAPARGPAALKPASASFEPAMIFRP